MALVPPDLLHRYIADPQTGIALRPPQMDCLHRMRSLPQAESALGRYCRGGGYVDKSNAIASLPATEAALHAIASFQVARSSRSSIAQQSLAGLGFPGVVLNH